MTCMQYKTVRFRASSLVLIEHCAEIIKEYMADDLVLTLRQLYYQLVRRNLIPNVERSYKNLSSLVTDARLAGLLDWDAIEDRGRVPKQPSEFESLRDLVEVALRAYRLPRWGGQGRYVELWVEKEALAGVLAPIASKWHVTLQVNKGYSSASAMRDSAKRFIAAKADRAFETGRCRCHLLYLGDFDPSGEDMVRDIRERLELFGANVMVDKLALTKAQIKQYKPPPNPAKITDPRAAAFIAEHGKHSWELDALPPKVLNQIVEKYIIALVDGSKMQEIIAQENRDKAILRAAASPIQ